MSTHFTHTRRACAGILGMILVAPVSAQRSAATWDEPTELPSAARQLVDATPGLQVLTAGDRAVAFFGKSMARAADPDASASSWWAENAEVFGLADPEIRELRRTELGLGELTVFAYEQLIDGVPVENSTVRLLVRNDALGSAVTLASANLVPHDGPRPDKIGKGLAERIARGAPEALGLVSWTDAREVYLYQWWDERFTKPVRCWKTQGWNLDAPEIASFSFYVDAETGAVVHVQDEIDHLGTDGSVTAFATPGDLPDVAYNPPVSMVVPHLEIRLAGGGPDDFVYTDANGEYSIDPAGHNLVASLRSPYLRVEDYNQPGVVLSLTQRPTQPDFVFNDPPGPPGGVTTDQVNAFIVGNKVVDFYLQHHLLLEGTFAGHPVLVQIDYPGSCHNLGGQEGLDLVYVYGSGGGCASAAYSSAITHEFSHYVHDLLGIWPGASGGIAFAEGYADCVSFLLFDSPFMAHDMSCVGDYTRNPVLHPVDYDNLRWIAPTGCAEGSPASPHYWGQLLSGIWWDAKLELQAGPLGPVAGRDRCRYLFTAWSLATSGISTGPALNPMLYSMAPFNLIEVLALDDDNGDLGDGTPNQGAIEAAFAAHGITQADVPSWAVFLRGEVNGDGAVDIADAVEILDILFGGGSTPPPTPCDRADTNSDGVVNIADATYLLNYLFSGGAPPAAPFPVAAPFPTTASCP